MKHPNTLLVKYSLTSIQNALYLSIQMGTRGPYPGLCYGDANQTPKAIEKDGDCAVKPRKEYDEAYDNMWTKVGTR